MIHKHRISFRNAWHGLKWALTTQPNYKIHATLSFLALAGGLFFRISYPEFLTIGVLICVGLSIETINTAIEETNDAIDEKIREDIGLAKDISAGAMLMFAVGAFIIACIIFLPRILGILNFKF
jgi:diacylglycerol kinase